MCFRVCHRLSLCVSVSVTHIEWFDEDKKFAVAFTDGVIYMCLKNMEAPVVIEAHQVSERGFRVPNRDGISIDAILQCKRQKRKYDLRI